MIKAGIMGGTFNPVHKAHLMLAEQAYEQLGLDKIIFIPSKNPPHKNNVDIVSDEHRFNMLKLAISGHKHFELSDIELRREGITYTLDTVYALKTANPNTEYSFIIGGDSLMNFLKWRHPEEIVKYCHIVAAGRYGYTKELLNEQLLLLGRSLKTTITFIDIPDMAVSSEMIRRFIAEDKPVKDYLPEQVYEYIQKHRLYQKSILEA